jgi:predicted HAD superfamily Cof-like phosphohydrolase
MPREEWIDTYDVLYEYFTSPEYRKLKLKEQDMSTNWSHDIFEMHEKFGTHTAMANMDKDKMRKFLQFRIQFLQEELDEMKNATSAEDVVDALIDLCVVAIGTLDAYGVDANQAWDEVLKANLNKEVGIKKSRPNPLGLPDLIKPPGWVGPDHTGNHGTLSKIFE